MAFMPAVFRRAFLGAGFAALLSSPTAFAQAPIAENVVEPTPVVMPESYMQTTDAYGRPVQQGVPQATKEPWAMPSTRFRGSVNVTLDLGYQIRYDLQPLPQELDFIGFATVVVDRADGNFIAQTAVEDPLNLLSKATVAATAPVTGSFQVQGHLEDLSGNSFEFYIDQDRADLPTTLVRNTNSFRANSSIGASGEFYGEDWSLGAAVAFDVSPIFQQQRPELSSASVYLNTRAGSFRVGRGIGLPYATRSYEVISGGGYSFADFGTYQASYVSPVVRNTRVGILLGLQTRQVGVSAEWQLTRGNNQVRAAAYADTARSIQGELGYTRALGPQRFVGGSVYGGRDDNGEAFFGVQGNVDIGRHSLQANLTRVLSNNLVISYGNSTTNAPLVGIDIRDTRGFNRQDQLNLEYRFQATQNVQLYAQAELIRHKYYGTAYAYGGGVRAAF